MAEASIPVDLFNPGQVFACLGFMEAADILLGDAEGGFDWSNDTDVRFRMRANGDENPFAHVLEFLAGAEVVALAPPESALSTDKWGVAVRKLSRDDVFPFPEPNSPATLPIELRSAEHPPAFRIVVDHWGDGTVRDNVKYWAGAGGYPGAALFRDGLDLCRQHLRSLASDPFAFSAPQSSSFRLDWRRDYIPLEVGFSPNLHGSMEMIGYPVVELLAVIGLSHARPYRHSKLDYAYGVSCGSARCTFLPLALMRVSLGGQSLPFGSRRFRYTLGWPGQENQARCIIDVLEETDP